MEREATNLSGSLVVRGILAIIFGVAAIFWPGLTLVTLVYLFSAFILVNGIMDLIFGVDRLISGAQAVWTRILMLLVAVLQIGVGVYLLRHPGVSFATLILLIGFTFIVRGVFEIVSGLFEKASSSYKVLTILGGILAFVAGIVVLFQPVTSGVVFVWILGVYALITGPLMIALAMDVKRNAAPTTKAKA